MKFKNKKTKQNILSIYRKGIKYQYYLTFIQALLSGFVFCTIKDLLLEGKYKLITFVFYTFSYFLVASIFVPTTWKRFLKKYSDLIKNQE